MFFLTFLLGIPCLMLLLLLFFLVQHCCSFCYSLFDATTFLVTHCLFDIVTPCSMLLLLLLLIACSTLLLLLLLLVWCYCFFYCSLFDVTIPHMFDVVVFFINPCLFDIAIPFTIICLMLLLLLLFLVWRCCSSCYCILVVCSFDVAIPLVVILFPVFCLFDVVAPHNVFCLLDAIVPLVTLKIRNRNNNIYNNLYVKIGFENQLV